MRSYSKVISLLMLTVSVPAFAANGLHKHDSSIASYNYNIQIETAEDPGNTSLRTEMDQAEQGGSMPAAMPASGNAMASGPMTSSPAIAPAMAVPTNLAVGATAPNFQLARADGQVVSLHDLLTNGPALVLFTPSTTGLQLLQKNQAQFKQLGINTVAVSSQPLDSIQRSNQAMGVSYPVLSDTNHYVAQQYGLQSMNSVVPALYSIDQNGKIAAVQILAGGKSSFDLNEATAPLRNQTATMAPAPVTQQPQSQMPGVMSQVHDEMTDAARITAPAGQQRLAPNRAMPDDLSQGSSMNSTASASGSSYASPLPATPSPRSAAPGMPNPNNSGINNSDSYNSGASNSGMGGSSTGSSMGGSTGGSSGSAGAGGGKVKFIVPPSNPDFKKSRDIGLSI